MMNKNKIDISDSPIEENGVDSFMEADQRRVNEISIESDNSLEVFSLSLQKGFKILKILLFVLAVLFIFSNIYWVDEGNIAIHSRFGKIIEKNGFAAIPPGGPYFALPAPIDTVIKIPTTMQKVAINKAFWLENNLDSYSTVTKNGKRYDARPTSRSFSPGVEGSLITGDKNIVQGQWSVNFQLNYAPDKNFDNRAPEFFMKNVGNMKNAEILVQNVIEQAIVKAVAQLNVEEFVKGNIDNILIKRYTMTTLANLKTGIKIVQITPERYTVPIILAGAFRAVNQAQSEKASQIETAKRYRAEALNETAGSQFKKLIAAINLYEKEFRQMSPEEKIRKENAISILLKSPKIGGRVSEMINDAKIYKTQTVEFVKGTSGRFQLLLKQYLENPAILKNRLMQDTFQKIFSGNVKTFYLPQDKKKTIYIEVND